MDNFRVDITSEGSLVDAMKVACQYNATGYKIDPKKGLIFYKYDYSEDGVVRLPFTLDAEGMADFARRWLAETPYGPEPGHDGDNGKGWRIYNEDWGHVGGCLYAFIAVKPAWAMYGK